MAENRWMQYGDVITLQFSCRDDSADHSGFLSSDGFIAPDLWVHTLSAEAGNMPPNLHNCCFEITRPFKYTAFKVLQKKLRSQGKTFNSLTDKTHDEDSDTCRMKSEWEREQKDNEDQNARMRGQMVVFGSNIQLRHLASGRFITVLKTRAVYEPHNTHVRLDNEHDGNERSWLRISLGYRAQNDGEQVRYNDDVCFQSVKSPSSFLHVTSPSCMICEHQKHSVRACDVCSKGPAGGLLWSNKVLCVLSMNSSSTDAKSRFLVRLFQPSFSGACAVNRIRQPVLGGQVVVLTHKEVDGCVGYDASQPIPRPWLLHQDSHRSNSSWRIEPKEVTHGGFPVGYATPDNTTCCKLRHLATGMYLAVSESNEIIMHNDYTGDAVLWQFEPFHRDAVNGLPVCAGTYLYLKHCSGKFVEADHRRNKRFDADFSLGLRLIQHCDNEDVLSIMQVPDEEVRQISDAKQAVLGLAEFTTVLKSLKRQLPCPPSPDKGGAPAEAGGRLPPLPGAISKHIQLSSPLLSTRQLEWAGPGEAVISDNEVFERLSQIEPRTLEILEHLQKSLDDDTNATSSLDDDQKMASWQQLLREQNAIEELVNVICLPLEMRLVDFGSESNFPELITLVNKAHSVVQLLCSRNHKNQIALFNSGERILSVLESSAVANGYGDPMATLMTNEFVSTNLSLYWDNKELLMKIPPERIRAVGTLIRRHRQPIYLKFLQALCTTLHKDGTGRHWTNNHELKPLKRNQNLVFNEILLDPAMHGSVFLPWRMYGPAGAQELQLKGSRDALKWYSTKNMSLLMSGSVDPQARNVTHDPNVEMLLYHVESIELLATICLGRNTQVLMHLVKQGLVPSYKDLLTILFELEAVPPMLLCAYTKLLTTVYVDQAPFEVLPPPSQTRVYSAVWSETEYEADEATLKSEDIWDEMSESRPSERFNDLRELLITKLSPDSSSAGDVPWEPEPVDSFWPNQLTSSLLGILELLLSFGVFRADSPVNMLDWCAPAVPSKRYNWAALKQVMSRVVMPMLEASGAWPAHMADKVVSDKCRSYVTIQLRVCGIVALLLETVHDWSVMVVLDSAERAFEELNGAEELDPTATVSDPQPPRGRLETKDGKLVLTKASMPTFQGSKVVPESPADTSAYGMWDANGIDSLAAKLNNKMPLLEEKIDEAKLGSWLLRLTKIPDQKLQCEAFKQIFTLKRRSSLLAKDLGKIQLLKTSTELVSYREITVAVHDLSEAAKLLLLNNSEDSNTAFVASVKCLNNLIRLVTISGGFEFEHSFGYSSKQVKSHQQQLMKAGALETVAKILAMKVDTVDDANSREFVGGKTITNMRQCVVLQLAHDVIQRLCLNSKVIQDFWFRKKDLILAHASIRALDAARTLGSVVEGNFAIAERLPAATLRCFVNLLIDHGRKPRWLRTLRSLVVVDGKPVKANQEVVLHLLLDEAYSVLDFGMIMESQKQPEAFKTTLVTKSNMPRANLKPGSRMELMKTADHKRKNASQLLYHTNCIELLVACVQGHNSGAETRLRQIFSWEDIVANVLDLGKVMDVNILAMASSPMAGSPKVHTADMERQLDQDVLRRVKAPFVRLLTQLFINIDQVHVDYLQKSNLSTPRFTNSLEVDDHPLFARWWENDPDEDEQSAKSCVCLIDEFIWEITDFSLRLKYAFEHGGHFSDAEVQQPYTFEQQELRGKFIAGCEEATGQLAESIRIAFCDGSDPADILNIIDQNGDGVLNESEWESGLKASGIMVSEQDAAAIWALIDGDGSGTVDSDEMALFLRGGYKNEVRTCEQFDVHLYYVFDAIMPALYHFFLNYGDESKNHLVEGQADKKREKGQQLSKAISELLERPNLMSFLSKEHKDILQMVIHEMMVPTKAIGVVTAPKHSTFTKLFGNPQINLAMSVSSVMSIKKMKGGGDDKIGRNFKKFWSNYVESLVYQLGDLQGDPGALDQNKALIHLEVGDVILFLETKDTWDPDTECPERMFCLGQIVQVWNPFVVVSELKRSNSQGEQMEVRRHQNLAHGTLKWVPATKYHIANVHLSNTLNPKPCMPPRYNVSMTGSTDFSAMQSEEEGSLFRIEQPVSDYMTNLNNMDLMRDQLDHFEGSTTPLKRLQAIDYMSVCSLLIKNGQRLLNVSDKSTQVATIEWMGTLNALVHATESPRNAHDDFKMTALNILRASIYAGVMSGQEDKTAELKLRNTAAKVFSQAPLRHPPTAMAALVDNETKRSMRNLQLTQVRHIRAGGFGMVISHMASHTKSRSGGREGMIELVLDFALSLVECGKEGNEEVQLMIFDMLRSSNSRQGLKPNAFMTALSELIYLGRADLKGQMKQLKKAEQKDSIKQSNIEQWESSDSFKTEILMVGKKTLEKQKKKSRKEFKSQVYKIVKQAGQNGCVPEVLRLLECLCTGKTRSEFQNHFREQKEQSHSVDLIAMVFELVVFAETYFTRALSYKVSTPMEWLHRGLETIEMFVRGPNMKNVEHIMSHNVSFLAIINSVLLNAGYCLSTDEHTVPLELSKLKVRMSMLQLLRTLLESDDGPVANQLTTGLRWDVLLWHMTDIYHTLMPTEQERKYTIDQLVMFFKAKWVNEELMGPSGSANTRSLVLASEEAYEEDSNVLCNLYSELIQSYHVIAMLKNTNTWQQQIKTHDNEDYNYNATSSIRYGTNGPKDGQLSAAVTWERWGRCMHLKDTPEGLDSSAYDQTYRSAMTSYCMHKTRSVEILRAGRLEKVYFPITQGGQRFMEDLALKDSAFKKITGEEVLSDTADVTVGRMMQFFKEVMFQVVYTELLRTGRSKFANFLCRWRTAFRTYPQYLMVAINLFLLLFYDPIIDADNCEPPDCVHVIPGGSGNVYDRLSTSDQFVSNYRVLTYIHTVLAVMHVCASIANLCCVLIVDAPVVAFSISRNRKRNQTKILHHSGHHPADYKPPKADTCNWLSPMFSVTDRIVEGLLGVMAWDRGYSQMLDQLQEEAWLQRKDLRLVRRSWTIWLPLLYLVFSVLGLVLNPLFFAVHTLTIFEHPVLSLVLKSVTTHAYKLVMTFLLMVQITYLFSIVGFVFFWNKYADYRLTCSTIFQCTLSATAEGFKSDGIADLLTSQIETLGFAKHIWSDGWNLAMTLWNLLFYLIVVLILVAVFTGIIIDSFDCYSEALPAHRLRPLLQEKEHKENTPQEVYMQNCLRDDNDSIRFFPIEMTADLRNEIKRDREGLMDEKLGTIVEQLGSITDLVLQNDGSSTATAIDESIRPPKPSAPSSGFFRQSL